MGQFYNELPDDEKLIEWIKEQKLFHVATAPLKGILFSQDDDVVLFNAMDLGGHVNVSPKGLPSFKLVNKRACWYLDLAGSSEISSWSSHLRVCDSNGILLQPTRQSRICMNQAMVV